MSELLGNVRKNPNILTPVENREIVVFTISLSRPMGVKRSIGNRSFIGSVLQTLDDFYGDVVEHLKEWQPPAPKLQKDEERDVESNLGSQGSAEPESGSTDSSAFLEASPQQENERDSSGDQR